MTSSRSDHPADPPVAAPDPAARVRVALIDNGDSSSVSLRVEDAAALLVERQQAEERNEELTAALKWIEPRQQSALQMMQRNGFVFCTPLGKPDNERTEAERWEKLAFTLYSELCEADSVIRAVLAVEEDAE